MTDFMGMYGRNAVALSAEFHSGSSYEKVYGTIGHMVGGFPGIYDLVAEMAHVLTAWEQINGSQIGCGEYDWLLITEYYSSLVKEYIMQNEHVPNRRDLMELLAITLQKKGCLIE